jgi:hypothetical protein
MKKIFIMVVFSLSLFKAQADEGMWLPMLLGKQVYADMVKKGTAPAGKRTARGSPGRG